MKLIKIGENFYNPDFIVEIKPKDKNTSTFVFANGKSETVENSCLEMFYKFCDAEFFDTESEGRSKTGFSFSV